MTTLQIEKISAEILGTKAFQLGKKCVPALDSELMNLLSGKQVGEGAPLMKAWLKGWTNANLSNN